MQQLTSASSVPSQDIEVSRSHAADERFLRGTGEPCSRDRRQRLVRIVVAVIAMCAAILVAAAVVRIGRMKSDGAASPLGSADALPASAGTTHSNVRATVAGPTPPPVSGVQAGSHCPGPFGSRAQARPEDVAERQELSSSGCSAQSVSVTGFYALPSDGSREKVLRLSRERSTTLRGEPRLSDFTRPWATRCALEAPLVSESSESGQASPQKAA
jgi:hypothetical protein